MEAKKGMANVYLKRVLIASLILILIFIGTGCGKSDEPASTSQPIVNTVEGVKAALENVLLNGDNQDKISVAYKIREVKQVGENEYTAMIYSDLGDATNYSGNTYQILQYINDEITSKTNVQFYQISVQYFKKIGDKSIRICTYQIPKEQFSTILNYGQKDGNPLADLKQLDGVTEESSL